MGEQDSLINTAARRVVNETVALIKCKRLQASTANYKAAGVTSCGFALISSLLHLYMMAKSNCS